NSGAPDLLKIAEWEDRRENLCMKGFMTLVVGGMVGGVGGFTWWIVSSSNSQRDAQKAACDAAGGTYENWQGRGACACPDGYKMYFGKDADPKPNACFTHLVEDAKSKA